MALIPKQLLKNRISKESVQLPWETIRTGFIILIILASSSFIAYTKPSSQLALLILAAIVAIIGGTLLLEKPPLGILLLVAASLLIPYGVGTGTGTTLNPTILLLAGLFALWLLDMALRQQQIKLFAYSSIHILLAFCAVATISFIVGQFPWIKTIPAPITSQLAGLSIFYVSAIAFLLTAHQLNEQWLQRLVYLLLIIGSIYITGRLIPFWGNIVLRFFDTGAVGSVFWIWIVALAAGQAIYNNQLSKQQIFALIILILTTLTVGFLNRVWASGWLPPAISLAIILWLRYPRLGKLIIIVGLALFIINYDQFLLLVTSDTRGTLNPWESRLSAWSIVLEISKVNLWLGLGPANYYYYVQQVGIVGWNQLWFVRFSSHNNYVDLIAQVGLVGLLFFLWFAFSIGRETWQLYQQVPNGFVKGYAASVLGGLVATLTAGILGDWFLPFVYNIGVAGLRASILSWIFLGGVISLRHHLDKNKNIVAEQSLRE